MEQISVNLVPSGIKGTCHASQFDIGRSIRFALLSGSNIYTLSGSETITMKIRKPDGTERTETLANTSITYVDLVTNRDTCDQSGTYDCEITVTDGGVVIGSGNFTMEVEADSLDGIIVVKTASGAVATFETGLPFPLQEAKFTLPYRAEGYTELTHYKATSTPVKDNAPYRLRKAPSGIGNRCAEKLIGASVAFNQNLQAQTFTKSFSDYSVVGNGDGTATLTIINPIDSDHANLFNTSYQFITGHKYYAYTGNDNIQLYFKSEDKRTAIFNATNGTSYNNIALSFNSSLTIGEYTIYLMLIDLTAFFGSSAIADHLYNLETETAGAGVAKFKALGFDAPYFPYTAGQLMSSAPVAKKIIGKNLFGGDYNVKFSIFIPEGTEMTASCKKHDGTNSKIQYFRKDGTQIDFWALNVETADGTRQYRTFTLQEDIYSVSFYGAECEEMQLEFGSSATTYEPHEEKMTIYSGEELRGIFELDANNNIVANGDTDDGSGTGTVRFEKIDLGSLDWTYDTPRCYAPIPSAIYKEEWNLQMVCDKYEVAPVLWQEPHDKTIGMYAQYIYLIDSAFSDTASLIAGVTGHYIICEKAAPTTKSIRTWDNPQPAMAGGTEEFIDGNVYGAVDLGSLEWVYTDVTGHERMRATLSEWKRPANNGTVANGFCEGIEIITANAAYSHGAEGLAKESDTNNIYFYSSDMGTDAAAFKAAMSGHWLIYEKAAEGPAEMPCGHDTTYADNLKYSKKTFTQIFGGDLDAVTGVLTSKYNSDGTQKTTPDIIQLTPEAIIALLGTNTVWNDAGETEVKFVDLKGEET